MSPITITSINRLNLQKKSGTLSNYAQRFIKSQVKSTSYALDRFFGKIDSKLVSQNGKKLKEIGIKQIGKDIYEGIIVSDNEFDYHVFSLKGEYLGIDILKPDTNQVFRHFSVNYKNNNYTHAGNFLGLNIDDEMGKVLDFVEGILLKAKSEFTFSEVPKPFIPAKTTTDKIAELNKVLCSTKDKVEVNNFGHIGSKEEKMLEIIADKLSFIQDLYRSITHARTKQKVKNSYKNFISQSMAGRLGFKNIGPKGESISLFNTSYKNNAYTAIEVTDVDGKELKFVISKDNKSVQKDLPCRFVKSENSEYRILIKPNYYTQKEVEDSNLYTYLSCLDKEMEEFIKYTQNWFKSKEELKLIKSNHDTATLEQYKDILNDVHSSFEEYRTKMRKYLRKPHKSRKFKAENNISEKLASTAVKFDNITPEGYDLRLSYPKVHDKNATQLLVMSGDRIENSFYIINNKLLRFKIKDLNDKITHYNQNLYYFDNKYLEASKLKDYLLLIKEKLLILNRKLDAIREKQIENRIKYHIKTSKE